MASLPKFKWEQFLMSSMSQIQFNFYFNFTCNKLAEEYDINKESLLLGGIPVTLKDHYTIEVRNSPLITLANMIEP